MGHSMGGGEVCTLMGDPTQAELLSQVRGWILEAPFIGFTPEEEPSMLKITLGRLVGRLLPNYQLKHEVLVEFLSHDKEWVESVRNDPLCHNTGTLEGLAALLDRTAILSAGNIKVDKNVQSIWLGHGTNDMTCSYDKAMAWLERQADVKDKTAKSYDGAYHQLHADDCKDEFAADLVDWILSRAEEAPVEAKL
jgi:acylglycerol lipase